MAVSERQASGLTSVRETVTYLDIAHLCQATVLFAQLCAFNNRYRLLAVASHGRRLPPPGSHSRTFSPVSHLILHPEAIWLVVVGGCRIHNERQWLHQECVGVGLKGTEVTVPGWERLFGNLALLKVSRKTLGRATGSMDSSLWQAWDKLHYSYLAYLWGGKLQE